jgi:hypothetical protein
VRFYVQQGAAWVDLGVASFNVYNLAATPLALSHSRSVNCDEARKFCSVENILNVRATLSWEIEPPPGDPAFGPPWGNVVDARVQVAMAQYTLVALSTLISEGVVTIDKQALSEVDVTKELPAKAQTALSYDVLKAAYANTNVPAHRYGFVEVQKLLTSPFSKCFHRLPHPAT